MAPKKKNPTTIDEVYGIWILIGGLMLASDINQLLKGVSVINFYVLAQILFLLIKDGIIGGIAALIYKILKGIAEFLGL